MKSEAEVFEMLRDSIAECERLNKVALTAIQDGTEFAECKKLYDEADKQFVRYGILREILNLN